MLPEIAPRQIPTTSRAVPMSEEITFQDITGEPVSGRFEVSERLITVTLPDGRKTTADIEESTLTRRS
jgi:hypothetical protein